jgi:hypothetical protein
MGPVNGLTAFQIEVVQLFFSLRRATGSYSPVMRRSQRKPSRPGPPKTWTCSPVPAAGRCLWPATPLRRRWGPGLDGASDPGR